jgi:hypothetical protein
VAVVEGDEEQPAETPITADISAAATVHPHSLFDGGRARLAMVIEADESGEDAGTGGPDVAPEAVRAGRVPWGLLVGSQSFMRHSSSLSSYVYVGSIGRSSEVLVGGLGWE